MLKKIRLTNFIVIIFCLSFFISHKTLATTCGSGGTEGYANRKAWSTSNTIETKAVDNTSDGAYNIFPDYSQPTSATFPAFEACYNLEGTIEGWYLPSLNELSSVAGNVKYIPSFLFNNGNWMSQLYWSSNAGNSTAQALGIRTGIAGYNKDSNFPSVRCMKKVACTAMSQTIVCQNGNICGWRPSGCGEGYNCLCSSGKTCDTATYNCVECNNNSDCSNPAKPICDNKICKACTADLQCKTRLGIFGSSNYKADAVCVSGVCHDSVCADKNNGDQPWVSGACGTGSNISCLTGLCGSNGKCGTRENESCGDGCGICISSGSGVNCTATSITKANDCGGANAPCSACSGNAIGGVGTAACVNATSGTNPKGACTTAGCGKGFCNATTGSCDAFNDTSPHNCATGQNCYNGSCCGPAATQATACAGKCNGAIGNAGCGTTYACSDLTYCSGSNPCCSGGNCKNLSKNILGSMYMYIFGAGKFVGNGSCSYNINWACGYFTPVSGSPTGSSRNCCQVGGFGNAYWESTGSSCPGNSAYYSGNCYNYICQ